MTLQTDSYCTVASRERTEIVVKSSRFIGSLAPAKSKDEAMLYIDDIRKEFYDATHNCFAYRIGAQGLNFRTADDGEPNGSAGKPILFSIQKADVSDVVVVVTRYFGGTKFRSGGRSPQTLHKIRCYPNKTASCLLCLRRYKHHQATFT
jgi:putative IMPACT (imprinted ancient) family translation regulator